MIYQEAYETVLSNIREDLTGFFPEEDFCRFWDQAENSHFNFLDGQLAEYYRHDPAPPVKDAVTKDIESRLSPFLKTDTVVLTDGVGQLPVNRWSAPRTVAASGYKKKCGGESTARDRRHPVKWAGPTEFNIATSAAFQPQEDTGLWCHWQDSQIKVTPLAIHAVEIVYYIPPVAPTPATMSSTIPWGQKDIEVLINKVVTLAGNYFGASEVIQFGMNKTQTER